MRAVIAGCGLIASRWTRTILRDGRIHPVALVDPNRGAALHLADRHGLEVSVHQRLDDALSAQGMDVLINLTPPDQHADITIAALRAGLHVLTEKPLAPDLVQARELVTAAEERGLQLHVMQNRGQDERWLGLVRSVRERDGGPLHVGVDVSVDLAAPGFRTSTPEVATVDLAIHAFDQVRKLITTPAVDVLADESTLPFLADHCTIATLVVRFDDRSVLSYRGGYTVGPGPRSSANGRWRIQGRDVHATWDGETDTMLLLADNTPVHLAPPAPAGPAYATCVSQMIDALTGTQAAHPAARSNLGSVSLLDAALRSIRTGRRCPVEAGAT